MAAPIVLTGELARTVILPGRGGRVQSLRDLCSGRELLYQRAGKHSLDFLAASTGGWDELFPNDAPFAGHPDHGRVWSAAFVVGASDPVTARLSTTLAKPPVTIDRHYSLLTAPRRGVRVETRLSVHAAFGPALWSSHPMLASKPGWLITAPETTWRVDDELPGRFSAGTRIPAADASTIAPRNAGFVEVLYADGVERVMIESPDGTVKTLLTWDSKWFPHLWLVTVSGEANLDLCLLPEPSTAPSWRLEAANERRGALHLAAGATRSWWVELEACDEGANARSPS